MRRGCFPHGDTEALRISVAAAGGRGGNGNAPGEPDERWATGRNYTLGLITMTERKQVTESLAHSIAPKVAKFVIGKMDGKAINGGKESLTLRERRVLQLLAE